MRACCGRPSGSRATDERDKHTLLHSHCFLPGEQGTYDDRRVQKLDIVDRPIAEAVDVFRRYLTYAKVNSGEALKSARADYKNLSKRKSRFKLF